MDGKLLFVRSTAQLERALFCQHDEKLLQIPYPLNSGPRMTSEDEAVRAPILIALTTLEGVAIVFRA